MYDLPLKEGQKERIEKAINVLSDQSLFLYALIEVVKKWPICSEENLSNVSGNRRAWCGQVACNYLHGVTERETRKAWGMLSDKARLEANKTADKIIKLYENKDSQLHQPMGKQMLF